MNSIRTPDEALRLRIQTALLRFASERTDRTFCPSEVARALRPKTWRRLMPLIREEAERLVAQRRLRCWQKGALDSPTKATGPIRLSSSPKFPDAALVAS